VKMQTDMKRTRGMKLGRLAMRYYPDSSYRTALRRFREEILLTRDLLPALQSIGYSEHQRYFSPRQVQMIEQYLGEP
jgi:hypothetical protein